MKTLVFPGKPKQVIRAYQSSRKDDYNVSSWYENKKVVCKDFGKKVSAYTPYFNKSNVKVFISYSENTFKIKDYTFTLPTSLMHIQKSIMESAFILDLNNNWDDEGAIGISNNLWFNAINFLIEYSVSINRNYNIIIESPSILPCSDGSIDLSWKINDSRMLINFRNSEQLEAHYYADKYSDNTQFKGSFPTNIYQEHIASWLKNLKR